MNFQPYLNAGEKGVATIITTFRNLPWVHHAIMLNSKSHMLDEMFASCPSLKNSIIHSSLILLHTDAIQLLQQFRREAENFGNENVAGFLPLKSSLTKIDALLSEFNQSQMVLHRTLTRTNSLQENYQKYSNNYNQQAFSTLPAVKAELDTMKICLQEALPFFTDALQRIDRQSTVELDTHFPDWQIRCEYRAFIRTITQFIKGM